MSEQHDAADAAGVVDGTGLDENGSDAPNASATEQDAPDSATAPDQTRDQAPDQTVAIDLDAIEADLTDVQRALDRLNEGSYWTDEVTGETIPDDILEAYPLARTVAATLD